MGAGEGEGIQFGGLEPAAVFYAGIRNPQSTIRNHHLKGDPIAGDGVFDGAEFLEVDEAQAEMSAGEAGRLWNL